MKRREFMMLLSGAAASWPLAARAQQEPAVARIGLLSPFSPATAAAWHKAFLQGLRDLGWVEGKNIRIEYRYANGGEDRLPDLATELVRLKLDVIVTTVNTDTLAAKNATSTIPIVMASAGDPVGGRLVKSLARPGGNITGLSQIAPDLAGKRLQLLKEIIPRLTRVAVLWNPQGTTSPIAWKEIQRPAQELSVKLQSLPITGPNDFDKAFEDATRAHVDALIIMPDPFFAANMVRLANLAAKSRIPSMFHLREYAEHGGVIVYGVDRTNQFRRAATYVDRILKGTAPADLPVEQPTRFELVINLKAAKALGLDIPPTLLARADEVIE